MSSLIRIKTLRSPSSSNGTYRPRARAWCCARLTAAAQKKDTLVYTGCMPLEGLEFLGAVSEKHQFVAVESPCEERICVSLHDFLPINPKSPLTAVRLLSGGSAPGEVRTRKLRKLPRGCRLVGKTHPSVLDALASIKDFNRNWDTELRLQHNDCSHYAHGLISHLCGTRTWS
ncbi:hypothetical protein DUNSADRAFT_5108, partial [Dunaliella salina]